MTLLFNSDKQEHEHPANTDKLTWRILSETSPKAPSLALCTELNFTNTNVRNLSAFDHDYSFTYGCDYKYIISLRFCFIEILNCRGFLAALFSHI